MKYRLLSLLFSFYCYSFGQNETYKVIYDSVYPLIEKNDYQNAKKTWEKYRLSINADPSEQLLFLSFSLKNNDEKFYKKHIVDLMHLYGWSYKATDTLPENIYKSQLLQEIKQKRLVEWTIKKSNKYYTKWRNQHPYSIYFQDKMNQLVYADQSIRKYSSINSNDSIQNKLLWDLEAQIDNENIEKIIELTKMNNGIIPNNFDNGYGTYFKINFIIWHSLKNPNTIQKTWDLLLPYIEKTYFAGKISYSLFMAYDKWIYQFFGYQYYGTLGENIPVKDSDLLEERKKKYDL